MGRQGRAAHLHGFPVATCLPIRSASPTGAEPPWPHPPAGVPGVKPVKIELTDFTTKEVVDELEVGSGATC